MIRKLGLLLGTGLVGLLTGCSSVEKPNYADPFAKSRIESYESPRVLDKDIRGQNSESENGKVNISFDTTFSNHYVGNGGFVIGSGPVSQNSVVVNRDNNFLNGDSVYAGAWMNYDFRDGVIHEADFFGGLNVPIGEKGNLNVEYAHWNYPSELLGGRHNHDNILKLGLDGKLEIGQGSLDVGVEMRNLFADRDVPEWGYLLSGNVSKTCTLVDNGESSVSTTLGVKSGFADGWFGLNGFTDVTPYLSLDMDSPKVEVSIGVGYQYVLPDAKDHPCTKDQFIYTVSAGVRF